MPIYAYKCSACGFAKDVLQKISDAPLTVCPHCGAESFSKQVTAAGFQLKGSGWYVTDFRDNGAKKGGDSKPADSGTSTPAAAPAPAASPAPAAPAPAPAASPAAKSD
ncbi:MAG: zinc ribbon domain-containing protein [Proteobacteria bacterium]|nr:zinc ribbon domain-containing protein [Pseudomonadota bacterium]